MQSDKVVKVDKQKMLETVKTYLVSFNSANPQGIADLFAQNGSLQDPYGSPSKSGMDAILGYYKGAAKKGTQLVQKSPTVVAGNRASFAMTVVVEGMTKEKNVTDADLPAGSMEIDVIDMFEFDEEGKIIKMTAYWDPEVNIKKNVQKTIKMQLSEKQQAAALIKSIETGAKEPIGYVNPNKYIQHNLDVADGLAGFGAVLGNPPEGGFKADVLRSFQDGDYAFSHTKYDFFGPKAGFDIFRFEDGKIVEHWDNLTPITKPNPSGRTQFDGATEITDRDKTEANKKVVKDMIDIVLIQGKGDQVATYINPTKYYQHNSSVADGLDGFSAAMKSFAENNMVMIYEKNHMVFGEGNFVLAVSEGKFGNAPGDHVAYYDLFRLKDGQIVEHWDVIQNIPAKDKWKNNNGKF